VSVNIPSNVVRAFQQLVDASPSAKPQQTAQQVGLTPDKVVQGAESTPTAVQTEQATDAFAAEALKQAWAGRFQPTAGAAPVEDTFRVGQAGAPQAPEISFDEEAKGQDAGVLQQTKDKNCGAAVAVMLGNELGTSKADPTSNKQKMDALESRFTQGQGTSPHELSNMLANQGAKVTDTSSQFDQGKVDKALANGSKAAVMVDSSLVDGSDKAGQKGQAHWVTVEGKDDKGNYTVKDPSTGKKMTLSPQELKDAVGKSWEQHQGGGTMIVDAAKGTSEAQAAQAGGEKAVALGNTDGGGSRAMSNFGRESS
jgi:hypothetical protein